MLRRTTLATILAFLSTLALGDANAAFFIDGVFKCIP